MCLIGVALDAHPSFSLIVVANRDELHARPCGPMHWWDNGILAGQDLKAGGTWLGLNRRGRLAAVTNYRERPAAQSIHSRGQIPLDYLDTDQNTAPYCEALVQRADMYAGFNALLGTADDLWWVSNRAEAQRVEAGIHALSNHQLNTPWPKVARLTERLQSAVGGNALEPDTLIKLLGDRQGAADDRLPDTGVGLPAERILSPMFIVTPGYGTRCSTVVRVSRRASVDVLEVSYDSDGNEAGRIEFTFSIR